MKKLVEQIAPALKGRAVDTRALPNPASVAATRPSFRCSNLSDSAEYVGIASAAFWAAATFPRMKLQRRSAG